MTTVFTPREWVLATEDNPVWVSFITTADNDILLQSNDTENENCDLIPPNGIYCKTDAREVWDVLIENGWKSIK